MKLYDLALVCRSKNAGPFLLTIDLMFRNREDYDRALRSERVAPANIARLYRVRESDVAIKPFERLLTVKVVIARTVPSGSPGDTDVYGSQQHFPLGEIEL